MWITCIMQHNMIECKCRNKVNPQFNAAHIAMKRKGDSNYWVAFSYTTKPPYKI